jgi:hypothetical protein
MAEHKQQLMQKSPASPLQGEETSWPGVYIRRFAQVFLRHDFERIAASWDLAAEG